MTVLVPWLTPTGTPTATAHCPCRRASTTFSFPAAAAGNLQARIAATSRMLAANHGLTDLYFDLRDLVDSIGARLEPCSTCERTVAIMAAGWWTRSTDRTVQNAMNTTMSQLAGDGTWFGRRFPPYGTRLGPGHDLALDPVWVDGVGLRCMWHVRAGFGNGWSPVTDGYSDSALDSLTSLLTKAPQSGWELLREFDEEEYIPDVATFFAALDAAVSDPDRT